MNVMIVDDSPTILRALSLYLSNRGGAEVTSLQTGAEGIQRAHTGYDLIVLDLCLRDMGSTAQGGILVCQQIRQQGYQGPMIALSGHIGKQVTKDQLLQAGFDHVLEKRGVYMDSAAEILAIAKSL